MKLVMVGISHKTAPVELRERLAVSERTSGELLAQLRRMASVAEGVILSTCNRVELYVVTPGDGAGTEALLEVFRHRAELTTPVLPHVYRWEDGEAIRHLFRVAAGLDSMVVGEHEILAQVKQAYHAALAAGHTGKLSNVLFQRSLYVGKLVRTHTLLSRGALSVGSVAVSLAGKIFGDLRQSHVMILGAGKIAEMTARHLLSQKVRSVLVANRTYERACALARELGGQAVRFDQAFHEMRMADIVICSTAAPHPIITRTQVESVMRDRRGRSLFVIDIAVPRDVEPAVHGVDNVYLYNIDDLQAIAAENLARRSSEVTKAERLIADHAELFLEWYRAWQSGAEHSLPLQSPSSFLPLRLASLAQGQEPRMPSPSEEHAGSAAREGRGTPPPILPRSLRSLNPPPRGRS
ncbi:MAG: glutamyl-tRNA reductase [Elusimicrobia bacterium]|nr:glutamyl-tRNA reductase [Elusimicrobiota bacterium]